MKNKKLIKAVAILTVTCALIAVFSAFFTYLLPLYLSYKFNKDTNGYGSIGIIGGADGPTAIFLSGPIFSHWFTIVFAALAILGIICLIFAKNPSNKA